MNKTIYSISFLLWTLLTMVSCDFDAHLVEYKDVMGIYRGEGKAAITVGEDAGIDWPDVGHLSYGDTLLHTITSPDSILMVAEVDTDNRMTFFTSVPSIHILGRQISIHSLGVESVRTAIKGNHVVTWDSSQIETSTTVLPLHTLYVPVNQIDILYSEGDGEPVEVMAKGYVAALLSNYRL